jgi:hypothetical protein
VHYKFRGIDDVYNALHPLLAENGVFTIPQVLEERSEERTTRGGGALIYRILRIKYIFYAEDGSSVEAIVIGEGMDSGDKASNKGMAVGHKYTLLQAFAIPTEEGGMIDPDKHEHQVQARAQAKAKATARARSSIQVEDKRPVAERWQDARKRHAAKKAGQTLPTGAETPAAPEAQATARPATPPTPVFTAEERKLIEKEITDVWVDLGWDKDNWAGGSMSLSSYSFGKTALTIRQIPEEKLLGYRDYCRCLLLIRHLWVDLHWSENSWEHARADMKDFPFGTPKPLIFLGQIPVEKVPDYTQHLKEMIAQREQDSSTREKEA